MWEYTDKVKNLFLHPKNIGEVDNPDAVGDVGSIVCGMCTGCLMSNVTINGIQNKLRELVGEEIVIEVQ
jgi:Fe-S cluster biogenesis protein NfuA